MTIIYPIYDGENAGEAFEKINRAMARTDLTNTTHILTKNRFGRWKTITLTEDTTFQIIMEVEAHYDAVRIGIPNLSTEPVPGVRASVSHFAEWIGPNYLASAYPPAGWKAFTWGGESSVTLPARIASEIPSVTFCDFSLRASIERTDVEGGRPIVVVRVQYPTGSKVTVPYNEFYGWRTDTNTAMMRVSKDNVLGVDNSMNFDSQSAIDTGSVIPIVQYSTIKAGRQLMGVGDSTTEGVGPNTRCNGPLQRACRALSTLEEPFEYYNAGIHASGAATYIKMVESFLNVIKPTVLVYQPYSVNDVPTGGMNANSFEKVHGSTARMFHAIRNSDIPTHVVLLEGLPCNPGFKNMGAGDQSRRDINTRMHEYTGVSVPDYASAITGERNADGQDLIIEGMSNDNVHPNEAGSDALAARLIPVIDAL